MQHLKERVGQQAAGLQTLGQQFRSLSSQQPQHACMCEQVTASLTERVSRLESLTQTTDSACKAVIQDRNKLRQQVAAMQVQLHAVSQQHQQALQQLTSWQSAFGAFARHVGSPTAGGNAVGDASAGWGGQDRLQQTGNGRHGLQLVPYDDSASSGSGNDHIQPADRCQRFAAAMHRHTAQQLEMVEPLTSTGTVAGPGSSLRRRRVQADDANNSNAAPSKRNRHGAAGSRGHEDSNALRTTPGPALSPRHEPMERRSHAQQGKDAQPGPALRMTPDPTGGTAASGTTASKAWKGESRAVSIVEDWLAEVTGCTGSIVSAATVEGAAAGLFDALLAGECPMTCVVAGFETALLQCAAPRGLGAGLLNAPDQGPESAGSHLEAVAEETRFSGVWCRPEALQCKTFTSLLSCALRLQALLQTRALEQGDLISMLLWQLHTAAVHPERLQAALNTEACCLAAAAAALYRTQGNQQVSH